MGDYERRQMLLEQTTGKRGSRKLYEMERGNSGGSYAAKNEAYMGESDRQSGTLGLRAALAVLLFIGYVICDYGQISVAEVSSQEVVSQIEKQISMPDIWK